MDHKRMTTITKAFITGCKIWARNTLLKLDKKDLIQYLFLLERYRDEFQYYKDPTLMHDILMNIEWPDDE